MRRDRAAVVAICLTALLSGLLSRHVILDDGAIVERYVRQVLAGHGWVWNVGERRNALTSFVHPALVLAVAELTRSVGFATHAVGTVTLAAAGVAAWGLLRRVGAPNAGLAAGLAVTVFPPLTHTWGLETALYVACLLALPLTRRRRTGVLAALTVLTRPDGVIGAGVAVAREALRGRKKPRELAVTAAIFAVPVAVWALWQKWRFGAWLPASVGVKADQGATASGGFSYSAGWRREVLDVCGGQTVAVLVVALAILGLGLALARRAWPLLEVTGVVVAQQAVFALVPVPSYRWYYVPFLVVGMLLASYAVETVVSLPQRFRVWPRRPLAAVAAMAAVLLLAQFVSRVPTRDAPRESEFAQAAAELPSGPGPLVAATEVGELGDALPTSVDVVDLSGLTTDHVLADPRWRGSFWRLDPGRVVLHWFPGPLRRDAVTTAAEGYERESGLRVDGGRQRRDREGEPPGGPFSSEAVFLADPRFTRRYRLVDVVSRPGPYASLLLFVRRGGPQLVEPR